MVTNSPEYAREYRATHLDYRVNEHIARLIKKDENPLKFKSAWRKDWANRKKRLQDNPELYKHHLAVQAEWRAKQLKHKKNLSYKILH